MTPCAHLRTAGLFEMRFDWGDDQVAVTRASGAVNERNLANVADAYEIVNEIFLIVRQADFDQSTGKQLIDADGWRVWKRTSSGGYIEDYC